MIDYQRQNGADRALTLDIVDYPGEWLLDLPLLNKSYEQWSAESLALSREGPRAKLAADWHAQLATLTPSGHQDEQAALAGAKLFTEYLRSCRDERFAMSLLPPGRFLMPGNLAGTPALTFAPLDVPADGTAPEGSLWAMMVRRYEAYKDVVVRPFFRDHFSRLDRQIVLVDALAAFNSGPEALHDIEAALAGILDCFRVGRSTLLSAICSGRGSTGFCLPPPRPIICTIPAMTGWRRCCGEPWPRPWRAREDTGAAIDVVALAAVRATREARSRAAVTSCRRLLGTPAPGESANGETFDGNTEVATFPGDLPADAEAAVYRRRRVSRPLQRAGRKDRFSLSALSAAAARKRQDGGRPALPHIRLDRALQFLIGDRLQ